MHYTINLLSFYLLFICTTANALQMLSGHWYLCTLVALYLSCIFNVQLQFTFTICIEHVAIMHIFCTCAFKGLRYSVLTIVVGYHLLRACNIFIFMIFGHCIIACKSCLQCISFWQMQITVITNVLF